MEPLILTARLQPESQLYFDQLRCRHFPPERNFLPAHLTLFHALPGENSAAIASQLNDVARREPPMEGSASRLRSLGGGVAFDIDCPRLVTLRASLARIWHSDLTRQDRQTPRLHITVQNKVSPGTAQALLGELSQSFQLLPLLFEGLDLWRYLHGPWAFVEGFPFTGRT